MIDPGKLIAVVDDDYSTRTLITEFLSDYGFLVVPGERPEEIDEQVEKCQAFIMDVMIYTNRYAGINYIIEQRQKTRIAEETLVIFISNFSKDDDVKINSLLRQAGKYEWLDKPITFTKLKRLLE